MLGSVPLFGVISCSDMTAKASIEADVKVSIVNMKSTSTAIATAIATASDVAMSHESNNLLSEKSIRWMSVDISKTLSTDQTQSKVSINKLRMASSYRSKENETNTSKSPESQDMWAFEGAIASQQTRTINDSKTMSYSAGDLRTISEIAGSNINSIMAHTKQNSSSAAMKVAGKESSDNYQSQLLSAEFTSLQRKRRRQSQEENGLSPMIETEILANSNPQAGGFFDEDDAYTTMLSERTESSVSNRQGTNHPDSRSINTFQEIHQSKEEHPIGEGIDSNRLRDQMDPISTAERKDSHGGKTSISKLKSLDSSNRNEICLWDNDIQFIPDKVDIYHPTEPVGVLWSKTSDHYKKTMENRKEIMITDEDSPFSQSQGLWSKSPEGKSSTTADILRLGERRDAIRSVDAQAKQMLSPRNISHKPWIINSFDSAETTLSHISERNEPSIALWDASEYDSKQRLSANSRSGKDISHWNDHKSSTSSQISSQINQKAHDVSKRKNSNLLDKLLVSSPKNSSNIDKMILLDDSDHRIRHSIIYDLSSSPSDVI